MTTPTDFATVNKSIEEFDKIAEKHSQIKCECFGLFTLTPYEEHGSQGTKFIPVTRSVSEDALMQCVFDSLPNTETYLILPITLCGNGDIFATSNFEQVNITQSFYDYKGPCKILLASVNDYGHYKNPNKRVWIPLKSVFSGIEDSCAEGYATIEEPDIWKPYDVHKTQMCIIWKK